jgi:predicted nucleotidyltransferase
MRIEKLDGYERVPLSDATRTLLCDFAAGDLKRPLHRLEVDWEKVFQGVCRNGLLGLTHRYLKQWEPRDYPPPQFRQWIQQAYRTSAIRMALMYRHIGKVLAQLAESGVDYMVVKGPALAHTVYPDPALRAFNDLDLVVQERDWAIMHRLLVKMGFKPEADLPQPPPKLVPQAVLYELKYWHQETGVLVEVHYDDLFNTGLASRDIEGFWQRAIRVDVEGVPVKALSLEDQLIHLCAHAHYHGYTRLNCFSDMAFIVRDHAAQLDWERLIQTVRVEEAQVGVYYSLRFLEQLLGVGVPGDVLTVLQPDRFRRWWHERYLPEEKVLSLQPMCRPDFSFYFIPLFKRLLPDLLVMGRRGDKLRYLLRLLLPPRTWLRDYYRLSDAQNIAVHYLLHPLKLMVHYLAEVVTTVF